MRLSGALSIHITVRFLLGRKTFCTHRRVTTLCVFLVIFIQGCGIVIYPQIEKLPDSFSRIEVLDSETHTRLQDVSIEYYILPAILCGDQLLGYSSFTVGGYDDGPSENAKWLGTPTTQHVSGPLRPVAVPATPDSNGMFSSSTFVRPAFLETETPAYGISPKEIKFLTVCRQGETFVVQGASLILWRQVLWPWPVPNSGNSNRYGHISAIVFHAPGHRWMNLNFLPDSRAKDGYARELLPPWLQTVGSRGRFYIRDGLLTIEMPPVESKPSTRSVK